MALALAKMRCMEFLRRILGFAARGFVVRTDALQIVVAAAAPGLAEMMGWQLPDTLSSGIPAYLFLVVLGWAILRLLTAPYFVWKEDQEKITELQRKISDPARVRRERKLDMMLEEREQLIISLTNLFHDFGTITSPESAAAKYRQNILSPMSRFQSEGMVRSFTPALGISLERMAEACNNYFSSQPGAHLKYVFQYISVMILRDAIMDQLSDDPVIQGQSIPRWNRRGAVLNRLYAEADFDEDGEIFFSKFSALDCDERKDGVTVLPQQR